MKYRILEHKMNTLIRFIEANAADPAAIVQQIVASLNAIPDQNMKLKTIDNLMKTVLPKVYSGEYQKLQQTQTGQQTMPLAQAFQQQQQPAATTTQQPTAQAAQPTAAKF